MLIPKHFLFELEDGVGTITLNRPDRLNSLTFQIYEELAHFFETTSGSSLVRALVITGAGRGFCSGGDQKDIIAELFSRDVQGLVEFTRTTGRLIQAMRRCRKPVVGAIQGVAVGAGAVIAAACDMRIISVDTRFGFLFPKVGLCGADMGASYLLPRIVGLGNASELLFLGQLIDSKHALRIGLANRIEATAEETVTTAKAWASKLAHGPSFAHEMTKEMLEAESTMDLNSAIEAEAQAQALCMQHSDFREAHRAFNEKRDPKFKGAP